MRIAMVSEHASPLAVVGGVDSGGQNVHVAALATELGRRGMEVVVHTRRDDRDLPRRVALAHNVVVDHVDAGPPTDVPKDELLVYMDAFADDLRRQWRAERPDIVHSHFWMSGKAALAAAQPLGIPVAHTFHALGVVKRRHQGHADTSPPQRLGIERSIIDSADRIIATCSDEVRELAALGADLSRVSVVPCGVDLRSFSPRGPVAPRPSAGARLLFVGRLVERKGIGNTISALALLAQRGLDAVELVVAGGPDASLLDVDPEAVRLRRLAEQQGVGDRVRLLGRVERADLPALMRSADVVVCAPWYEPFGIVPLEAMACGVPVVGTAVGGLLDSVADGTTGVLVPPRRPEAIAEAVATLLAEDVRRRAMGRAGARRARALFGWPRIAEMTSAAYELTLPDLRIDAEAKLEEVVG